MDHIRLLLGIVILTGLLETGALAVRPCEDLLPMDVTITVFDPCDDIHGN